MAHAARAAALYRSGRARRLAFAAQSTGRYPWGATVLRVKTARRCVAGGLRGAAARPALVAGRDRQLRRGGFQRVLLRRFARLRRWSRRLTTFTSRGRPAGLGYERNLYRRLRGGAGRSGTALYLFGVSGRGDETGAGGSGNGAAGARRYLHPSFLLLLGVLPFWDALRASAPVRSALRGVNAVVVGLLLAALYHPVWTSAIFGPADLAGALGAFLLLSF